MDASSNSIIKSPNRKKFIISAIIIFLFLSIPAGIFYYKNFMGREFPQISDNIKNTAKTDVVDKYLAQLNDKKIPEKERYSALTNIVFHFAGTYSRVHDPKTRTYVSDTLKKFAKENFPEQYQESDFEIPCSDPECGRQITPGFQTIIDMVQESKLPDYQKDTIILNLKTVGYTPVSDKFNSVSGLTLIIGQLEQGGDSQASEAASFLRDYLKKTYSINYDTDLKK